MKKTIFTLATSLFALVAALPTQALAAINNPALSEELGGTAGSSQAAESGTVFVNYFIILWRGVISVGGLLVLLYLVWGAMEWITAAGEAGKITKARDKMVQAVIGLIILVSAFALIGLLSSVFFGPEFNLLNLTFPSTGLRAAPGE